MEKNQCEKVKDKNQLPFIGVNQIGISQSNVFLKKVTRTPQSAGGGLVRLENTVTLLGVV